ncbi:unnamed protein product [Adineta steineri]|uniref:Uncharacterized protein n=1 Tax=Adineta steineri TaxID=433720 RepID=A0A815BNA7_9BILA|nr:unnamed protein product [Adineta steineri]CAF1273995.1 unnamed protein product [Adineta steineri]CAF1429978.1 unnamed protein product [Adineta steineri]CAF1433033.1 unnamed protein product [Adineta steineri]CAF1545119.1 unnamed protein product [Adineta steineri]
MYNTMNSPVPGYSQLNPYQYSAPTPSYKSGGRAGGGGGGGGNGAILAIVGVVAAGILAGMALGLGLGIGAAGIVSHTNLTVVTNTTTIAKANNTDNLYMSHYMYFLCFIFFLFNI